mmetsp:Transcript_2889/g.11671  ORF Transcript_2889/g.11671 Transcript_2889/m.11671 type:complete len:264 (-) Transcript_2889:310-1101(-)
MGVLTPPVEGVPFAGEGVLPIGGVAPVPAPLPRLSALSFSSVRRATRSLNSSCSFSAALFPLLAALGRGAGLLEVRRSLRLGVASLEEARALGLALAFGVAAAAGTLAAAAASRASAEREGACRLGGVRCDLPRRVSDLSFLAAGLLMGPYSSSSSSEISTESASEKSDISSSPCDSLPPPLSSPSPSSLSASGGRSLLPLNGTAGPRPGKRVRCSSSSSSPSPSLPAAPPSPVPSPSPSLLLLPSPSLPQSESSSPEPSLSS